MPAKPLTLIETCSDCGGDVKVYLTDKGTYSGKCLYCGNVQEKK